MTKIFIIHGAYGNPDENWQPWLKKELEKLGFEVIIPAFPTPEGQNLENWKKIIDNYEINRDDVLVGHSIGPALILKLLENHKAKAAFLIAGFIGSLGSKEFDEINYTFFENGFDWDKIKENCQNIFVVGSDNDPYVPLEKTKDLARSLGVKETIIENAGHFNEKAGYLKFEWLLEKIKSITKE